MARRRWASTRMRALRAGVTRNRRGFPLSAPRYAGEEVVGAGRLLPGAGKRGTTRCPRRRQHVQSPVASSRLRQPACELRARPDSPALRLTDSYRSPNNTSDDGDVV